MADEFWTRLGLPVLYAAFWCRLLAFYHNGAECSSISLLAQFSAIGAPVTSMRGSVYTSASRASEVSGTFILWLYSFLWSRLGVRYLSMSEKKTYCWNQENKQMLTKVNNDKKPTKGPFMSNTDWLWPPTETGRDGGFLVTYLILSGFREAKKLGDTRSSTIHQRTFSKLQLHRQPGKSREKASSATLVSLHPPDPHSRKSAGSGDNGSTANDPVGVAEQRSMFSPAHWCWLFLPNAPFRRRVGEKACKPP